MAEILKHPRTEALQAIVDGLDPKQGGDLFIAFRQALMANMPRGAVVQYFKSHSADLSLSSGSLGEFIVWSRGQAFHTAPREQPIAAPCIVAPEQLEATPSAAHSTGLENTIAQLFGEAGASAQGRDEFLREIASIHKYGWFVPGWQFDNTDWASAFGQDDPVPKISFFVETLFAPQETAAEVRIGHLLTESDHEVIDMLLEAGTRTLVLSGEFEGWDRAKVRKMLNAACRAWLWDGRLGPFSSEYFEIGSRAPNAILCAMIDRWVEEDPRHAYNSKRVDRDRLEKQLRFLAAYFVKTLGRLGAPPNSAFPVEDYYTAEEFAQYPCGDDMDSRLLVAAKHAVSAASFDANIFAYERILSEAIYRARDPVFLGRFPFSHWDAFDCIGSLEGNPEFVLARLFCYSEGGLHVIDDIDCDPVMAFPHWVSNLEEPCPTPDLARSQDRWNIFKSGLLDFIETRLDELARAWWAFFIASQARAFPNMGLSVKALGEVADQTRRLLPDPGIEKAVRYALASIDDSERLSARILRHEFGALLRSSDSKVSIVQPDPAAARANASVYLAESIGEPAWRALHPASRTDLVDAEQLWSNAAHAFGVRQDWGGIVQLYARVVESEMKRHWSDLLDELTVLGLRTEPEHRTLGAMFHALRSAQKAIRTSVTVGMSTAGTEKLARSKALVESGAFWTTIRNNVAHGNREAPANELVLQRCRVSLLREGLLKLILDLNAL